MQSEKTALIQGLLFGSDEGFSPELKQLTKQAGVTHLVAASGANLRFVRSLWLAIFWPFGARFVQYSSPVAIYLYWRLAEQSGSLWRASGMWCVSWCASLWGKKIPLWYTLAVTTILTMWRWPQFLTPGFWLSFLAIVGVYFSQIILSGEKKRALFPQRHFWKRHVIFSLAEGSIVFGMVSLWLWPQYGVFEPIGILSTFLLGIWVEPMVWLGLLEQIGVRLPVVQTFLSWLTLEPILTLLFITFRSTLEYLAGLGQSVPLAVSGVGSGIVTFWCLWQWKKQRNRKMKWRRLYV